MEIFVSFQSGYCLFSFCKNFINVDEINFLVVSDIELCCELTFKYSSLFKTQFTEKWQFYAKVNSLFKQPFMLMLFCKLYQTG